VNIHERLQKTLALEISTEVFLVLWFAQSFQNGLNFALLFKVLIFFMGKKHLWSKFYSKALCGNFCRKTWV